MYRLVIVSGPNRGSSFTLSDGKNAIGRQMENQIVLTSSKVSKVHCVVFVSGDRVDLLDESSTNGTFINGALVKKQIMKPGDKLGVGDFVMELVRVGASANAGLSNVIPLSISVNPGNGFGNMPASHGTHGNLAISMPHSQPASQFNPVMSSGPMEVEAPTDPAEKIKFLFEGKIMPGFYGYLMKNEYRMIVAFLLAALVVASVVGSVMPTLDVANKAIEKEAKTRAQILAREVADRFTPAITNHNTSQIDLSVLENDDNVRMAAIVNLDMQIIAPQSRLNQMLAGGDEASFAMEMARRVREGDEHSHARLTEEMHAIAIEPIRVVDARTVKSQVVALVVVSIDYSRNMIEVGGMSLAYSIGFAIAGIAGVLIFLVLMRLTLKPFEVLNDDLDQVLRGDLPKVTHEFKIGELNNLWENINSAITKGSKGGNTSAGMEVEVHWDYELAAVRAIAEATNAAYIAFDASQKVTALNAQLDDVMGIRAEAIGQGLSQIARDTAFVALVNDLKERVAGSSSRSAMEETEFSGVLYQAVGVGVGPMMNSGLAIVFKKKG